MNTEFDATDDDEALAQRGLEQYENHIKAQLEPAQNGQFVAIHVPTGEYVVARNSPESRRALRLRFPTGYIVTRKIGNEPDYALAARLLAGEMVQGATK
jgi:hypothetical protein